MIRGRGLEKRYGRKWVLRGVDVAVPEGGFAVVTGPNGSGKTTLLRLLAGLAQPTRGDLVVGVDRARVGYLAHEALVYRELTAVENLDLFGRLYRIPERRERIGMLLERFSLWDARNDRVSTYSRGMTQRLALCRALLHDPELLRPRRALLGARRGRCRAARQGARGPGRRAHRRRRHARPGPARGAADRKARARVTYLADVAALTRKDLRVELRGRDTLPAMLLFVLATLVVFHFAIPEDAGDDAAYGLLWVAIVFTALLGLARAWVPEQEHGVLDGLVLAPCDRSAIWLGKTLATLAFLLAAQAVALPAFVLFFEPLDATALAGVLLADIGICAVGSLMSAMAAAGRAREVLLPLLVLPLAIPLVVGGVGAAVSAEGGRFLLFLLLYDAVFAVLSWASFEYVVTE